MILRDLLQNLNGANIKVGANANFVYCGENNENANHYLQKYLDRQVIYCINGVSIDEPNTKVIKVVGCENGRYWTIKEFEKAQVKVQIKNLRKTIKNLIAKAKTTKDKTIKQDIEFQKDQIKQQIKSLTLSLA